MNEFAYVLTKFYLQSGVLDWIWPVGHSLLIPVLNHTFFYKFFKNPGEIIEYLNEG